MSAVPVDDPLLPVARHLAGRDATDLLRVAVASFGGDLAQAEAVQVQHRPGQDLVVRYDAVCGLERAGCDARPSWPPRPLAPPGTLVLAAAGVEAGVWRYPFDPLLPGLADAVTPGRVDRLLAGGLRGRPDLEVVAYRPIRRAVVRATDGEREVYSRSSDPRRSPPSPIATTGSFGPFRFPR